jgi:periplasmic divalent cation tolerance protein
MTGKAAAPRAENPRPVMILIAAPVAIAVDLARAFVTARAAACAQVSPPVTSIYVWDGKLHEESESLILLKTTSEKTGAVKQIVAERHPYEVPEVIEIPVTGGNEAYFTWINEAVAGV